MLDLAFSQEGAERVAALGFTCVHLPITWGLPPELENNHTSLFQSAVQHYHRAGIQVYGWLPVATCIPQGSYADKDWYALDPYGHRIPSQRGYYFTALLNPAWQTTVTEKIQQLIDSQADGIVLSGYTAGGLGVYWRGLPIGPIGSHDPISQQHYAEAFDNAAIPITLAPKDAATQQYIKWRISSSFTVIKMWCDTARQNNPNVVIQLGSHDPITTNHYLVSGLDLDELQDIQLIIEKPTWPYRQPEGPVTTHAIGIVASHTRTQTVIPIYGSERMGSPREYQRNLSEAVALNTPALVQGMGFQHKNTLTGLLHTRYQSQQQTIQSFNQWLEQHHEWLINRTPSSPLAVYYPYEATHWNWNPTSHYFMAVCQTLLLHGYPLRIVGDDDSWAGVEVLVVPPATVVGLEDRLQQAAKAGVRIITIGQKRLKQNTIWKDWKPQRMRIPAWRWGYRPLQWMAIRGWRSYQRSRLARRFAPRLIRKQPNPHLLPTESAQIELIQAIGEAFTPRLESEAPALLTIWSEPDGTQQWHIVNYSETPQRITLHLGNLTNADVYTLGLLIPSTPVVGSSLIFTVDSAKIVRSKG